MKPGMTFKERSKLGMELLSKQPPFTAEQMKASVERVHAGSLLSVKERIENAKTDPKTKIDELVIEQAEIAKVLQDVITASLPVIPLKNDKWRFGTWYEIAQPNQQESTIYLKHPFYFKRESFWGIGLVVIQLCEHVLGYDETLLIRFENRGEGSYADIHLAVSKKLSEMGYDSVVFYETEPLQLKGVYSVK
jgi:hypothetical protein